MEEELGELEPQSDLYNETILKVKWMIDERGDWDSCSEALRQNIIRHFARTLWDSEKTGEPVYDTFWALPPTFYWWRGSSNPRDFHPKIISTGGFEYVGETNPITQEPCGFGIYLCSQSSDSRAVIQECYSYCSSLGAGAGLFRRLMLNEETNKIEQVDATDTTHTDEKCYGEKYKNGELEYKGLLEGAQKPSLFGELHYSNGRVFKGEFENERPNNFGQVTFETGETWVGVIHEDLFAGEGILTKLDGT